MGAGRPLVTALLAAPSVQAEQAVDSLDVGLARKLCMARCCTGDSAPRASPGAVTRERGARCGADALRRSAPHRGRDCGGPGGAGLWNGAGSRERKRPGGDER
ncbi:hypothetical protein DFR52_101449 [Hoeflea marina]|uniref:Uncharacterized protein n=1 Tax=Hoeflea marina TaxID=274592 RepID=A0A317PQK1_9HYPH|nr:hypothetical protein DFR52_101449 [Hoeflea marina]